MPVVTEIQTISETISKVIDFVQECPKIQNDFNEYLTTMNAKNLSASKFQAVCIPYITERIIFDTGKTIPEIYLEENSNITDMEKEIVYALGNTISSMFEVKRVLKNGFIMYNLVNEKEYTVVPLVKMTNLRDVLPTRFALVRILKFKDAYFMLEISDLISSYEREQVLNFAVAKIIEKPEDLYLDNEQKYIEVKKCVENSVKDFVDFFETEEIITTNKKLDNLINLFNEYQQSKDNDLKKLINDYIELPEKLRYFKVEEIQNSYDTFFKKSLEGFSSHVETYDVGYICDKKLGIYVVPFWKTLNEIFTTKDYQNISGYKECVLNFIKNDKLPPSILDMLISKCSSKESFEKRLSDIIEEKITTEEIIKKYKSDYMKKEIFSSSNVLYCSKTFSELAEME